MPKRRRFRIEEVMPGDFKETHLPVILIGGFLLLAGIAVILVIFLGGKKSGGNIRPTSSRTSGNISSPQKIISPCLSKQTKEIPCNPQDMVDCCFKQVSENDYDCNEYDQNGNCADKQQAYCIETPNDPLCQIKLCNDPDNKYYVDDIEGCVSYYAPQIFADYQANPNKYSSGFSRDFSGALQQGLDSACPKNADAISCVLDQINKQ